jgi:hypothetical protein
MTRLRPLASQHQAARLFRQINEDRTRLENRKIPLVAVDDCRDAAVGVDGGERRLFLLARLHVDDVEVVGESSSSSAIETFHPLGVAAV